MTTADLLGKLLQVVMGLAILAAVVGLLIFFIDKAPKKGRDYWQLAGFLLPAMLLVVIGLVIPAVRTSLLAFQDGSGNWTWDNFIWTFTQPTAIRTLINTVIWVLIVPTFATIIGLAYAVFIDRSRGEKYYKVVLFMPIAISFVGAGVIWRFVYEYRAEGFEQIGILNQLVVWFGGEPQQWLINSPWNTVFLIIVMICVVDGDFDLLVRDALVALEGVLPSAAPLSAPVSSPSSATIAEL